MAVIPAMQGIPPFTVMVQSGRPSNDKGGVRLSCVIEPFDEISPSRKLMDLIQDDNGLVGMQLSSHLAIIYRCHSEIDLTRFYSSAKSTRSVGGRLGR
jgi:hypothetical protein